MSTRRYRHETYLKMRRRKKNRRRVSLILGMVLFLGFWTLIKSDFRSDETLAHASQEPKVSQITEEQIQQKEKFTADPLWPKEIAGGAIGAEDHGVIATQGDAGARPTASIAKVITALTILEKYPLNPGELGPNIEITANDEELYKNYIAQNGTVTAVKAGVDIPLYNALEAMLLPSSNNMSDTAAVWAFGSLEEYQEYATQMVKRLDMNNTTIGKDSSGLDPSTTSTAEDLIKLGQAALKNPVIAEIVAKDQAEIPYAGVVPNHNHLVEKYGFTGLKPGASILAGETLLFSAKHVVNGKEVELIGVVLGAADGYSEESALQIMESTKETLRIEES